MDHTKIGNPIHEYDKVKAIADSIDRMLDVNVSTYAPATVREMLAFGSRLTVCAALLRGTMHVDSTRLTLTHETDARIPNDLT